MYYCRFFTVVGVLAMVLCFFILWLSFTANIHENAWEFGVLRAVGLNVSNCFGTDFARVTCSCCVLQSVQVVMVYVYEALALVLVGVILGTIVGTWLQHARYSNDWSSIMVDVWLCRLGDRDISHVAVQHV